MKRTAKEDLEHWEHLYKHRQYQEHFYPSYKYSSDELFNILNTVGDFKKGGDKATYLVVPSEVMRTALDILSMIVEDSRE
jgi:hypothetical protein